MVLCGEKTKRWEPVRVASWLMLLAMAPGGIVSSKQKLGICRHLVYTFFEFSSILFSFVRYGREKVTFLL